MYRFLTYYKNQKYLQTWQDKKVINWELLSAFDMVKLANDIKKITSVKNTVKIPQDLATKNFTSTEIFVQTASNSLQFRDDFLAKINPFRGFPILFVEGILVLNDPVVANLCDLKYFIKLDHQSCLTRRCTRVYDPPDPTGYFDKIVWPWYVKNLADLKKSQVNNVTYLDGKDSIADNFSHVLCDLMILLSVGNK